MSAVLEFYSVFLPNHNARKMRLPDAFVAKLRGVTTLPDWVLLTNQLGEEFHVEVSKESCRMYFDKGWPDFVDANGLLSSYFLLFRYNGVDTFDVKVYDHSGCEKYDDDDEKDVAVPENDSSNGDDDPNLEDDLDAEDDKDEYDIDDEDFEADSDTSDSTAPNCSTDAEGSTRGGRDSRRPYRMYAGVDSDAELVVQPGSFYFIAGTGLQKRESQVAVPSSFLKNLNIELDEKIVYNDQLGRKYVGRVSKWKTGQTWIGGWKSFCKMNRLTSKDKCIFELVMKGERKCGSMRVHIKRNGLN